ncbi:MAG: TIGR04282 family arsenosugar biosynthesis glycosyltransferase [Actinobacteria bacterium]|nr:TIGR04282 family arsenosugar biosynthesis glycosyltransferase [Actinomycetota bacterium]
MSRKQQPRSAAGCAVQLAVIAKQPVPGKVKTRLCPPCTTSDAASIAAASLADVMAAVAAAPASRRLLLFDGEADAMDAGGIRVAGFEVVQQCGNGLAHRLANGFDDMLTDGAGPLIILSADTPQVTADHLAHAAERLVSGVDAAVLGPCRDGGYWAIGLHRPDREVFERVPMSTPRTGHEQRLRLRGRGYAVHDLVELQDIDTFDDARHVAALAPATRAAAAIRAVEASLPLPPL